MTSPLNVDPRDIMINDEGDVMPPEELVPEPKRDVKVGNRGILELDHPMRVEVVHTADTNVTEEDEAVLRGIQTAKEFMEDPDSFGADWPSLQIKRRNEKISEPEKVAYTLDTRFIEGRQYICAIGPNGKILIKEHASEHDNTAIFDSVAKRADALQARDIK